MFLYAKLGRDSLRHGGYGYSAPTVGPCPERLSVDEVDMVRGQVRGQERCSGGF